MITINTKYMIHKNPIRELKELKLEILVKMSDLAVAGFGLVAALAWNETIQSIVNTLLPQNTNGGLIAKLIYAVIITIFVVLVTLRLSKMTNKAKEELNQFKEEEK